MTDKVGLLGLSVYPAMGRILREGELRELHLFDWLDEQGFLFTVVEADIVGERFRTYLVNPGVEVLDYHAIMLRLASDLSDFVAESKFGWGQLRE